MTEWKRSMVRLVLASALVAALGPADAAASVRSPCTPEGRKPVIVKNERQRLILATTVLRVFEVIDPADIAGGRSTYACLVGSRERPVSIASARPGGPSPRNKRSFGLQVAGRFVGYNLAVSTYSDGGRAGPAVRIHDVARRSYLTFRGPFDFLLRRDGSFDAIVRADPYPATSQEEAEGLAPGRGPFEVRRYGRRTRESVRLDAGEGIDPLSLVGDERRTYWLKAGMPMSASR